jgi:RNA polymerase sigma factor (TIGR02999 family)
MDVLDPQPREVDELIHWINDGDMSAKGQLIDLIFPELRRIASSIIRRVPPIGVKGFFDEDDLISEATIKLLLGDDQVTFQNKDHLFARFAQAMRSVLVDLIRRRTSIKRGGDQQHVSLGDVKYVSIEDAMVLTPALDADLIALNEALEDLAQSEIELAQVVQLIYFAGCTIEEAAGVLNVSTDTVKRRWKKAKIYLLKILTDGEESRKDQR